LLSFRKIEKCVHTYLLNWINMSEFDGKLHCKFNQTGTATFRLSSSNPNLQNVPFYLKEADLNLKALFRPDSDEYDLYDLDISNAEMRVLCAYSKDEALIDAFNNGKDLHCLTASGISEYSYEEILANKEDKSTDHYTKRQVAKKVNFGTIYCMMATTLQARLWSDMRIKITLEEAEAYLKSFFDTYPGVHKYITSTQNFVSSFKFTYTYTGRRRRFPIAAHNPRMINRVARQAVNARIQTTSTDIVGKNLTDLDRAIRPLGGRVILTVHDSIVFQLPKGTSGVRELLDNTVVAKTREDCPWLPVEWKYDCGYGPSYGEAKDDVKAA